MQPVRKASENIYSSQSGLKQRKTRIPLCSSPTTLSQVHEFTYCTKVMFVSTNMTFQIHKITKMQKRRSRSQCNTENHSSLTPISSFADMQILKHILPDSRIFKYHFPGSCIFEYHLTSSQIRIIHKSHGCLTIMTSQIPLAPFISLRPKTTQNIRTPFRDE